MIHEFDLYIYPRRLWVTYDATPEELNKEFPNGDGLSRKFNLMNEHDNAVMDRVANAENFGGILIRFNGASNMKTEIIAHECTHAANAVYDYIGASHSEDDEPFAYLVGYIAKCCAIARDNEVKEKQEE